MLEAFSHFGPERALSELADANAGGSRRALTEDWAGPPGPDGYSEPAEAEDPDGDSNRGSGSRGRPNNEPTVPADEETRGGGKMNRLINIIWILASMLLGTLIVCAYCVSADRAARRAQDAETLLAKARLEQQQRAAAATVARLSAPLDAMAADYGDCPVCLTALAEDDGAGAVVLACGHACHAECLSAWLSSRLASDADAKLTCPLCRAPALAAPTLDLEAPEPTFEMDESTRSSFAVVPTLACGSVDSSTGVESAISRRASRA